MPVFGVSRSERFFRTAAELDVDQNDPKRYSDFVERELYDLLLIGRATRPPAVVGGLNVALARTFRVIDPDAKNPQSQHWECAFHAFDRLI